MMQVHSSTVQDATVLRCDGRLTMVAAPALKSAIDEVVESGATHVVIDLSETSFVDSSGLAGSLESGGDLRIAEPQEQVRMVLALTNLDRILQPFDRLEDAVHGW